MYFLWQLLLLGELMREEYLVCKVVYQLKKVPMTEMFWFIKTFAVLREVQQRHTILRM